MISSCQAAHLTRGAEQDIRRLATAQSFLAQEQAAEKRTTNDVLQQQAALLFKAKSALRTRDSKVLAKY